MIGILASKYFYFCDTRKATRNPIIRKNSSLLSELEIFPNIRLKIEAKAEKLRAIDRFREVSKGLHLKAVLIVVDEECVVVAQWYVIQPL